MHFIFPVLNKQNFVLKRNS